MSIEDVRERHGKRATVYGPNVLAVERELIEIIDDRFIKVTVGGKRCTLRLIANIAGIDP
jgi:hypothetical protein